MFKQLQIKQYIAFNIISSQPSMVLIAHKISWVSLPLPNSKQLNIA